MRRLAILAALVLLVAGCRGAEGDLASPGAPIILISIDTLRADRLPAYGYGSGETPHIDAFRDDAILFRRAYSPSPMTLPSHVSMLTARLPNEHGVRSNAGFTFDSTAHPSVPNVLEGAGYATGAAVSSYVLRGSTGLAGAFQWYEDSITPAPGARFDDYQRSGAITAELGLEWIREQRDRPFFFFLHLYEPHVPYEPPEPFRSRFADPYDGEIATADAIVGAFLGELKQLGLYDPALIIVTSDHGEGLGDHGEQQHSILLYREAIEVPVLVKLPGGSRAGEVVEHPVQLADLGPTILEVAGIEGLRPTPTARSLGGDLSVERDLYAETLYPRLHFGWSELRSIVRGRLHYIDSPRPELYDMVADPGERNELAAIDRRSAAALRAALASFPRGDDTPSAVDPEVARRLAALGYIGTPQSRATASALANPVDQIELLEDIRRAFESAHDDSPDAEAALRSLLERNPSLVDVRIRLAELLNTRGDSGRALEEYRTVMRTAPMPLPEVALGIAAIELREGRLEEAERHAQLAVSSFPGRAHEMLGRVALEREDIEGASREAVLAARGGQNPGAFVLEAEIAQKRGDLEGALVRLTRGKALAETLRSGPVYRLEFVRADTLARLDRLPEASAAYRREIDAFPSNLDAYAGLAVVEYLLGNAAEVESTLNEMVRRNPTPRARALAERTQRVLGA